MRTIRRLYFYLVAFISAEVVIWGVISLLRTIFARQAVGLTTSTLAGGLAAVLVGLPIFWLHWSIVQQDARKDPDEHASQLRALFLYGIRFALLLPVAQSAMALLNHFFLQVVFQGSLLDQMIGRGQSWTDNLVALLINLVGWAYFERVLARDWQSPVLKDHLNGLRRLFRYVWMLYTLGLAVFGVTQILRFIFFRSGEAPGLAVSWLAGGLAMALVGAPLWGWIWSIIQGSLGALAERRSLLRLVVLYLLALVGVIVVLFAAGELLAGLVRLALGEQKTFVMWLSDNSGTFAALIPFAVLWSYFGRQLSQQIATEPDTLQQAALIRIYRYILAFLGNAATFASLILLMYALLDLLLSDLVGIDSLRTQISGGIAGLVIGLPLWLRAWRPAQAEAQALSEQGGQARRSTLRKAYLYLVIFLAVIGGMAAAGVLLFSILRALLSQPEPGFLQALTRRAALLVLVLLWLWYHLRTLRSDGTLAERALSARHVAYPVLLIDPGGSRLMAEIAGSLQRQAPQLPVAVHRLEMGIPEEMLNAAKAVVLPASLALDPPEALRLWLQQFEGLRVIVPESAEDITWAGVPERNLSELAQEAARTVRLLAEGAPVRMAPPNSPWVVAGYLLTGVFGLLVLAILISLVNNLFR